MTTDNTENPYLLWTRNVRDDLKSLSNEEIKADLRKKALPGALLLQHVQGDFNAASAMRSANGFGIVDTFYYGKRHLDRRGLLGCYHYMSVKHLRTLDDIVALKDTYHFVGLENNTNRKIHSLHSYEWKPNSLIIAGEENIGIVPELLDLCDDIISIDMIGSVRSFNLAVAASIAMYDYSTKLCRTK